MQEFQRANPPLLAGYKKEPLTDDQKFKIVAKSLIKGFLILSIPGLLIGIGVGWLIWG